ncbi:hypothetical protein [Riemerella columbipharyngis]|uniref:Uncharacterized protein n=1 Tax=Riemerella columbipharyngis TaxID=1071918 RepID=A0A1G7F0R4_9FLAO|nr:hypothetical protein [Riemerella columbipharyngis]SDE69534.1 hypothetical protein SAMN05421544_11851 [Riemerella columbipharyngis]
MDAFTYDLDQITTEWIQEQMNILNLKRKDVITHLGLDKSYMSRVFASEDSPHKIYLSRQTKAMFYYYFLAYKLSI